MEKYAAKLFLPVFCFLLAGCFSSKPEPFNIKNIKTYTDIPGVTQEEINAVEELKRSRGNFSYGQMYETEAFILPDGTYAGFAPEFCRLLSRLFGIDFVFEFREWDSLIDGLNSMELDFTGDLAPTEDRLKVYYMTYLIAERTQRIFMLEENFGNFETEKDITGLRVGYLQGSIDAEQIKKYYPDLTVYFTPVSDFDTAAEMLRVGSIDLFASEGVIDPLFEKYDFIRSKEFFPLAYSPVSMASANPALAPLISVVDKYIAAGGIDILFDLYRQGNEEYTRYKLERTFTDKERQYIDSLKESGFSVKIALEAGNYPVSFFDATAGRFEGIAPDVLSQISSLTGIVFETANDEKTGMQEILEMLKAGEVSLVSELLHSAEREGLFLWPDKPYASWYYALISRYDYPVLLNYQVVRTKVGTVQGSAFADKYAEWFPDNNNLVFYKTANDVFNALEKGEIDLMIGSDHMLLMQKNYYQNPGFKINIGFYAPTYSYFGLNIEEEILCSVICKTLDFINTDAIAESWTSRGYDYVTQMANQRAFFYFIIAVVMALMLLLTLFFLLLNKRRSKTITQLLEKTKRISDEEKKMTKALEEAGRLNQASISSLENILNSIDAFIYATVPETGELLFVNYALKKAVGRVKDNLAGEYCYKVFRGLDKICSFCPCIQLDIDPYQTIVWEEYDKMLNRNILRSDCYIDWPNGEKVHLQHAVDITDLTRRKEAEEKAKAESEAKSRFLANMSHEIRSPMNVILGSAESLLESPYLNEGARAEDKAHLREIREVLEKIHNSGGLLLQIINDILDLSKIEANKYEIVNVKYDVSSLINDAVNLNIIKYGQKELKLKLQIDENLPAFLFGDELRIKQIINNLLSNAFKYTDAGEVSLFFSRENPAPEEITLVICVTDTGQGMTAEQINRLFSEEYTRFNIEANRTTTGTGLGMAITGNLVKLMNGRIDVESAPGKGSEFTVRIPQGIADSRVLGRETADKLASLRFDGSLRKKKEKIVKEPMPYGKVLVVDDMKSNLDVAVLLLKPYQLQIDTALSGFEAADIIKSGKVYDIIFMDHMMPKMDGIETVKIIREAGYAHTIIALTANAIVGQAEVFRENGFDGCITKPIDMRELNAALNEHIRNKHKI